MNYIGSRQFAEQSKEVQNVFMEWWQPDLGDLFINKFAYNASIQCISMFVGSKFNGKIDKKDSMPLLQMHQLIQFIEYILKCEIISYKRSQFPCWRWDIFYHTEDGGGNITEPEKDLLQALWKVAIKIAEEG